MAERSAKRYSCSVATKRGLSLCQALWKQLNRSKCLSGGAGSRGPKDHVLDGSRIAKWDEADMYQTPLGQQTRSVFAPAGRM